jgi:hypothetical protein
LTTSTTSGRVSSVIGETPLDGYGLGRRLL